MPVLYCGQLSFKKNLGKTENWDCPSWIREKLLVSAHEGKQCGGVMNFNPCILAKILKEHLSKPRCF